LIPTVSGPWVTLALRGLVITILGLPYLPTYLLPGTSLWWDWTTIEFGPFMLAYGVMSIIAAVRAPGRGWPLIEGVVSGTAALWAVLSWNDSEVVASWAILIGAIHVIAAIVLRQEIERLWLMGVSGVLLLLFGMWWLLFYLTTGGIEWLLPGWPTIICVMVSGLLMLVFAFSVRNGAILRDRAV